MNDTFFSNSFYFRSLLFDTYHYSDNRAGAPQHYFAYMLSGNCKIVTDTETIKINEGEFFYIPNNCPYRSYWYGNPTIKFISLGFEFMPNFDGAEFPVQVIKRTSEPEKIFFQLAESTHRTAADIGALYTLIGMLIPQMVHRSPCRTQEIVRKATDYLLTHPTASASELARHCAVSEASLYSAFKKSSTLTPNNLKSQLILEKAKDALTSTDKPIEYISDTLGYSSTSYFRKKFKDYFGITPTEMRKRYRI